MKADITCVYNTNINNSPVIKLGSHKARFRRQIVLTYLIVQHFLCTQKLHHYMKLGILPYGETPTFYNFGQHKVYTHQPEVVVGDSLSGF